jgi:hypothetical protein
VWLPPVSTAPARRRWCGGCSRFAVSGPCSAAFSPSPRRRRVRHAGAAFDEATGGCKGRSETDRAVFRQQAGADPFDRIPHLSGRGFRPQLAAGGYGRCHGLLRSRTSSERAAASARRSAAFGVTSGRRRRRAGERVTTVRRSVVRFTLVNAGHAPGWRAPAAPTSPPSAGRECARASGREGRRDVGVADGDPGLERTGDVATTQAGVKAVASL